MRALHRQVPDKLPVTVHQWPGYHLNHCPGGISGLEAFRMFGMDASVHYVAKMGQFWLPEVCWEVLLPVNDSGQDVPL